MAAILLLVEDHDVVRKSLRDWLKKALPPCRVVEAASGEAAVAMVREIEPQLVVMDIGLPGISGIEATKQIKAILPQTLVVILTIHEGAAYRADAKAAGASAYVAKEAMRQELIPTITRLMQKTGPPTED